MVVHKIEKNLSSKEHCTKKQHYPKKLKPTIVKKKKNGLGGRYTRKLNRKSNDDTKKLIKKSRKNKKFDIVGVGGVSKHKRENDGKRVVINPSGIGLGTKTYDNSLESVRENRFLALNNLSSDWDNSASTIPKQNAPFREKGVLRPLQDSSSNFKKSSSFPYSLLSKPINIPISKAKF